MSSLVPNIQDLPLYDAQSVPDETDWAIAEAGGNVLSGCAVTATSVPSYAVNVAAGSVSINGATVAVSPATDLTPSVPNTGDRRDLVLVGINGVPYFKAGAPCQVANWRRNSAVLPPVKPDLDANTVALAEPYIVGNVPPSYGPIAAGGIIDKRLFASPTPGSFNVVDYGAVGDGETDCTAAINAAITACSAAGGGDVSFPPGTYAVSIQSTQQGSVYYALAAAANVRLVGSPAASTILLAANQPTENWAVIAHPAATDVGGFTVENLTIDMNSPNEPLPDNGVRFNFTSSILKASSPIRFKTTTIKNIDSINTLVFGTADLVEIIGCRFSITAGPADTYHDASVIYWQDESDDGNGACHIFDNTFDGGATYLGAFNDGVGDGSDGVFMSASANFTAAMVGMPVDELDGLGYIPADTTISSYQSATQVTLSATVSNESGIAFRIGRGQVGATTAIETHGPKQIVRGNTTLNFDKGANITGVSAVPSRDIQVVDNQFVGCQFGLQLWSEPYESTNTVPMSQLIVADNLVHLDPDQWAYTYGNYVSCRGISFDDSVKENGVSHLVITDNIFRYKTSYSVGVSSSDDFSSGIYLNLSLPITGTASSGSATGLADTTKTWAPGQFVGRTVTITGGTGSGESATITANTATTLTVASWSIATPDNTSTYSISQPVNNLWTITDNVIDSPQAGGIFITDCIVNGLDVSRNKIRNVGQLAYARTNYGNGIFLACDGAGVNVSGNVITDDQAVCTTQKGITFTADGTTGHNLLDVQCCYNIIWQASTPSIVPFVNDTGSGNVRTVFYDNVVQNYVALAGKSAYGSKVIDGTNGVIYQQSANPGAVWGVVAPTSVATSVITSSGSYVPPNGAKLLRVVCVGPGGSSSGAGSAGTAVLQVGSGGGGSGGFVEQIVTAEALTVTIGAPASPGAGGAAGGNNGVQSSAGSATTVTGSGVSLRGFPGIAGIASTASSITAVGFVDGLGDIASGTVYTTIGRGGASGNNGGIPLGSTAGGGGGGGAATTTNGGGAGTAGTQSTGGSAGSAGGSGTAAGVNGTPGASYGAGAGGAGGGSYNLGTGGAGGNGALGGPGLVIISVVG